MTATKRLRDIKWLVGGLHVLEECQRLKSVALAANTLQITPVAARNHLQALERHFGGSIFVRRSEPFVITARGAEVLAQHAELLRALRELQSRPPAALSDSIRICSLFSVMQAILIPDMQRISRVFPNVALTCSSHIQDIAGDFDVVIQRSDDKSLLGRATTTFAEPLLLLNFTPGGEAPREIAVEARHAHLLPSLTPAPLAQRVLNDPIVVLELARVQGIAGLCRLYIGAEQVRRQPDCFVRLLDNPGERLGVWAGDPRGEKVAQVAEVLRRQMKRYRKIVAAAPVGGLSPVP